VEHWFPVTENCFVKCICKKIIKYLWTCVLIRELGYTNPWLFPPSEKKVNNTTPGTGANLQHHSSAADASITRLLNRPSSCSLSADHLCTDWSLKRAELDSAANSTEKHYSSYYSQHPPAMGGIGMHRGREDSLQWNTHLRFAWETNILYLKLR
jgi:hypothetical protein